LLHDVDFCGRFLCEGEDDSVLESLVGGVFFSTLDFTFWSNKGAFEKNYQ
jgi:hypothetical protein